MKKTAKKYIIRGVSEVLDGLVVDAFETDLVELMCVDRIEQPSRLFNTFSVPVLGGLFIHTDHLKLWSEPEDDFQTTNPYGEFVMDATINRDGKHVTWSIYERCVAVKVMHQGKSLYTQNFYEDRTKAVIEFLQRLQQDLSYDMDDIVFDLKEVQDGDS